MACIVPSSPLSLPVVRTTHQRRTVAILLAQVCACVLSLSIVFPGDICKTNQSEHQDLWKVVMFVDHLTLQKAPCMFISFSCPSNAERQTVSSFSDKACKTETSPGFCLRLHVCQLAPSACLTTSLSDSWAHGLRRRSLLIHGHQHFWDYFENMFSKSWHPKTPRFQVLKPLGNQECLRQMAQHGVCLGHLPTYLIFVCASRL